MPGYEQDWKDYKRIRNRWLFVFAGYIPVVGAVGFISIKLFKTFVPAFIVAFLWMALFLITGIRVNVWLCPRCGEWFSGTWWYNLGFLARRCVHCGLRKYQNSDT
jgi:hypothetical protein